MAKSTSSNYKTKKEAQSALDRFKMEVASEIGVNLKMVTMETSHQQRLVQLVVTW